MIFDWFDTKGAAILGVKLAENLSNELAKTNNKKYANAEAKIMQKIFVQVDLYQKNNNLNFYKKSKLINEFRWRLLESGHDNDLVDSLTNELVVYVSKKYV